MTQETKSSHPAPVAAQPAEGMQQHDLAQAIFETINDYAHPMADLARIRSDADLIAKTYVSLASSPTPPTAPAVPAGVREALTWYAEQVGNCRKLHSEGDAARKALNDDCGKRATAALSALPAQPNSSEGEPMGIRVCPERDGRCPHGMSCPYTKDRYHCDIAASRAALATNPEPH